MTTAGVKRAFESKTVMLPLEELIATKKLPDSMRTASVYKTVEASIPVVGVIEPLVVFRQADGRYRLLNGHMRVEALRSAGTEKAECIVATVDEGYSYNAWVNRLSPIQANKMIVRTLDAGVSEERLASALARAPSTIRQSRTMLKDICPEALDLLKDKPIVEAAIRTFRLVKPLRQIEMAESMNRLADWTKTHADRLLTRTKADLLVDVKKAKPRRRIEDLIRIEEEMQELERDFRSVDASYGRDVVNLTIARTYVKKLLDNTRVTKYLASRHGDVHAQFKQIIEMVSLDVAAEPPPRKGTGAGVDPT